jgi:hypothetical protein
MLVTTAATCDLFHDAAVRVIPGRPDGGAMLPPRGGQALREAASVGGDVPERQPFASPGRSRPQNRPFGKGRERVRTPSPSSSALGSM